VEMKKKKHDIFNVSLDEEEQDISDAVNQLIDKGKLKSVHNLKEELVFSKEAVENYFRKDKRVNIRISSNDLARLKQKAAYKGLPYQTFIASVLHEYAAGHFSD